MDIEPLSPISSSISSRVVLNLKSTREIKFDAIVPELNQKSLYKFFLTPLRVRKNLPICFTSLSSNTLFERKKGILRGSVLQK